uniref:HD domain-containing protein n=1 Tax=viral metagenome TaxID=1070528 RepID=A0A6C0D638_9ZZZZ
MTQLLNALFQFVTLMTVKHKIDDSHGLKHSMDVLHFAKNIYDSEVLKNTCLREPEQERVIYISAVVHDMCDKKYMDESLGIAEIRDFLQGTRLVENHEIDAVENIISTMSYSTVKKRGFPDLGKYQHAYHIVREADLLSAYDFDRCMVYSMQKQHTNLHDAYLHARELFHTRVLKHDKDSLFFTDYSKECSKMLYKKAIRRMTVWKKIIGK